MGNKLEPVQNKIPDVWLRHIFIDKFDEFKKYYKTLPAALQSKIIQLSNGKELFNIELSLRQFLIQTWGFDKKIETKAEIEQIFADYHINEEEVAENVA